MQAEMRVVDLREEAASRVQSAAFYAIRDIAPGEVVVLLMRQPPSMMMASLDLQVRHNLAWTVSEAEGGWRVEVRHRSGTAPRDALDLLERDHKRLDGLLARALRELNGGNAAAAAPPLRAFTAALRRHIRAEDELLAPALAPAGAEPLAAMLREHREIAAQLALIEECLAADAPEAGETATFGAILSGTLAKHEQREEASLFPLWRARLAQLSEARQRDLMAEVAVLLGRVVNE
jgi:hemerythrin-like domain-containing protein